jgi:hypothetical protein
VGDEAEPNSPLSATNQLLFLAPENIKSYAGSSIAGGRELLEKKKAHEENKRQI